MDSAAGQVLQAIDELLVGQDDRLVLPMNSLNKATAELVAENAKLITQMQSRILRALDKTTTKQLDALDGVFTPVLQGLDQWQFDVQFLLQQLAAKGGAIKVGDPLEAALEEEVLKAPELAYAGTLVLAVKEAIPWIEALTVELARIAAALGTGPNSIVEVLREIRDRQPPLALRDKGEAPALEPLIVDEAMTDPDYSWLSDGQEQ